MGGKNKGGVPQVRESRSQLFVHEVHSGANSTRRVDMEQGEPVHGLGGRSPEREGTGGGDGGRQAAGGGRLHVRRGVHFGAEASDQDAVDGAGADGLDVHPHRQPLAPQRTALRRSAGSQQAGDCGQARQGPGAGLEEELRHPPPRARRGQSVLPRQRSRLRQRRQAGSALYRVSQTHRRSLHA
mmetsp:Transcript_24841/g.33082  ORF Transcript_24841/g.33082 Transcript_24841/m.33082 type:complete len:184 (+) Transcript_24841:156-707(+)